MANNNMFRWRAKHQTHGNVEGKPSNAHVSIPKNTHVLTNLDSLMQERMLFWVEGREGQLWLETEKFAVDFERT
jgi:hypothetical protein